MQQKFVFPLGTQGFRKLAYCEWGEKNSPTVLCVHGLTRNARDFDFLAQDLAQKGLRVVCVDMPGRGLSDRLPLSSDYNFITYLSDITCLIARLDVQELYWVGTSMGGLIGMMLAAQKNSPITRLVINDIGPWVPKPAMARIREYLEKPSVSFASKEEGGEYLAQIYRPFGYNLGTDYWRHIAQHGLILKDGRYVMHYDPQIAEAVKAAPLDEVNLWPIWEMVWQKTLVLRGVDSDLLLRETLAEMIKRKKGEPCLGQEIGACGHAPALADREQIDLLAGFLL